jgi:hypothetical protein
LENGAFVGGLQCWLGRSFKHDRLNETHAIPKQFCTPLQCELSPQARELLWARSRLDLPLWSKVASNHLPDRDVLTLRERTILVNESRYSALMTS